MKKSFWIGIAVIVLMVSIAVGVVVSNFARVPKVANLEISAAKGALQKASFSFQVEERYNDKPKGTVISQKPKAGKYLKKKSLIKLVVSKGLPPTKKLKVLKGHNIDNAIVINATNEDDGVSQEYYWIGKRYPGYERTGQTLFFRNGRPYDIIEFNDANGKKHEIYFDITNYFGKLR